MINRILIVGLGSIGKRHLRLARQLLPSAEIAVLRHQVDSRLPEGADYIFSTMAEALRFSPQLAVIANPASFHLSVAMPLAEAGVHLLIEKPLSATTENVARLIEVCRKAKADLLVGYNLRFLPSLQKFKSMLQDQVIGDVWSVRNEVGQYLPSWRPESDYRKAVSSQQILGGGVLLELSHEIDYLRWIFGEIEWVQAVLSKSSDLEIDVEDSAHLIFGFVSNKPNRPLIATLNLDFIRQDTTRLCTVIGQFGSLRWNGILGTVELLRSGETAWREVFKYENKRDESYFAEWENAISVINNGSKPFITAEDGLNVLQIIDAARKSAETKAQVKVKSNDFAEWNGP